MQIFARIMQNISNPKSTESLSIATTLLQLSISKETIISTSHIELCGEIYKSFIFIF